MAAQDQVAEAAVTQAVLAERYRVQQATLRALVVRDVLKLWLRLFDPAKARNSWPALRLALTALVRDRASMSAALATRYYADSRALAGVPGRFNAVPSPLPAPQLIDGTADSTGVGAFLHAIKTGQPVERARTNAGVQLSGSTSKLVLDAGRQTVQQAVLDDFEALGWARVTDAKPCAWCAMLSGRGPVYKSEQTASFQAHDHCACMAAAVFSRDEAWLGNAEELQQQWDQATLGLSGKDALTAWRQHWEGRTPTT